MKAIAKYSCSESIPKNHFNCIYCYVNKVNGKKYIGQAKIFKRRHYTHINYRGNYPQAIDRAIKKYGPENFEVLILIENLKTECLINFYECYYIDKFNTMINNGQGYNIASGGRKGNSYAGKTEEEMNIIREKLRRSSTGRKHTEEAKAKLREVALHRPPRSQDTRDKISASVTGELNGFYGRTHTQETKNKMSETRKGKCIGTENSNFGNRGSKNPISKKIICINLQTQELLIFHSIKNACLELGNIHNEPYKTSTISVICKTNKERAVYTHENAQSLGRPKTYKGYTYYYLEDYCERTNSDCDSLIELYAIESDYENVV